MDNQNGLTRQTTEEDLHREDHKTTNDLVEHTLSVLKKEYFSVGKTQVKSWSAWLMIGIITGITAGVAWSASRSGEVETGKAASSTGVPIMVTGMITSGGAREMVFSKFYYDSFEQLLQKQERDPLFLLDPVQKDKILKQTRRFVAVTKENISSDGILSLRTRLSELEAKDIRQGVMGKRTLLSFSVDDESKLDLMRSDARLEKVLEDHLVALKGNTPISPAYGGNQKTSLLAFLIQEASARLLTPSVVVGVVDTGVDRLQDSLLPPKGATYSPGLEATAFNNFFQPWMNSRSFPVTVPPEGGWINITAFFPAVFGYYPSPVDLDLVLKNEAGRVIAQSATEGTAPQSERIELFVLPNRLGLGRNYTADLKMKNSNSPRVISEYYDEIPAFVWYPSFTPTVEAGLFPFTLDVLLTSEATSTPPGALPSHTGIWKLGEFSLHGKTYRIAVSDVYPETKCYEYPYNSGTRAQYAFFGYDGVSIDINGDGNFGDQTAVGSCTNNGYVSPGIILSGSVYTLDEFYSTYWIEEAISNGRRYSKTERYLNSLNDKVVGFRLNFYGEPPWAYGPVSTTKDFLGHGTHVASIIKNTAPGASIYNAKVFGSSGGMVFSMCMAMAYVPGPMSSEGWVYCNQLVFAYESEIITGMEGAVNNGARVLNLSLGAAYEPPVSCYDFLMSQEVRDLVLNRNITVVVAAGNSGPSGQTITAPGCASEAITVGAVGTTVTGSGFPAVTNYSSRGPTWEGLAKPDLVAVGGDDSVWPQPSGIEHVAYLFPGGVISGESSSLWAYFGVTDHVGSSQIKMSGTSMATPQVAGAVVLLLEKKPTLTPTDIKKILMDTATDLGLPAETQGAGLLNIEKALKSISDVVY